MTGVPVRRATSRPGISQIPAQRPAPPIGGSNTPSPGPIGSRATRPMRSRPYGTRCRTTARCRILIGGSTMSGAASLPVRSRPTRARSATWTGCPSPRAIAETSARLDRRGPARALFFARIVRGIYVGDGEGALTVDLDDGLARSPGIVIHLGCRLGKSAGPQRHALLLVELVSHTDVERARKHRDVFSRRMIVRRDLVACGHFQPDDVQALLEGIAGDDGDLGTGRKDIGHSPPFQ